MDLVGLRRACQSIGNSPKVAMSNYALMKSTDDIDAGSADLKCDYKSDEAPPRNAENRGEQIAKTAGKTRVCDVSIAEAGVEPARALRPQDFKSCVSAIPPLSQVVTSQGFRLPVGFSKENRPR